MLNIFFSLFLLGMLIVLCGKAISRAMHQQQPLNSKEAALLIALSLGCLFALNAGVLLANIENDRVFQRCRICGSFFALRKKEADSRLLPRCLPLILLFCCAFCHRNPH